MVTDFSIISELKEIRTQKSHLSERENELSKPILEDLNMIPTLYEWFAEILPNARIESVTHRKKFLFVVSFLYSPSALAGGKRKMGLRDKLSEVTGVPGSLISHNLENVVFMYQRYKNYRKEIDHIYTEIMKRLNSRD